MGSIPQEMFAGLRPASFEHSEDFLPERGLQMVIPSAVVATTIPRSPWAIENAA